MTWPDAGRRVDDGMIPLNTLSINSDRAPRDLVELLATAGVTFATRLVNAVVMWVCTDPIDHLRYPPQGAAYPGEPPRGRYTGYVTVPAEVVRQLAGIEAVSIGVPLDFPVDAPLARGFLFDAWPRDPTKVDGALVEQPGSDADDWIHVVGLWVYSLGDIYVPTRIAEAAIQTAEMVQARRERQIRKAASESPDGGVHADANVGDVAREVGVEDTGKFDLIMASLLVVCGKAERDTGSRGRPTYSTIAEEAHAVLAAFDRGGSSSLALRPGLTAGALRQNLGAWAEPGDASARLSKDAAAIGAVVRIAMARIRLDLTDDATLLKAVRAALRKAKVRFPPALVGSIGAAAARARTLAAAQPD